MDEKFMISIVETCLAINAESAKIYGHLSSSATTDDLKRFWDGFSSDSKGHITFWNNLVTSAKQGMLPQIFNKPSAVLDELISIYSKVSELLQRSKSEHDKSGAFLIAFKLEFYMLHPAFETLFQYPKTLSDEKMPAESGEGNDAHVSKLFEALYQYDLVTLELELLGETLHRLWEENRKMAIQNNYDPLTGALNRRGLFSAVRHMSHLAHRNDHNVGVMMIDIDNFKKINDTFGHQFGDEVLKYVTSKIKSNIRASDVLGRYGGEEFLVFLSSIEPASLYDVGEKVRHAVKNNNKDKGLVTISIGLSQDKIKVDIEKELHALIKKADDKLFLAKKTGKDRVVV